LCELHVTSDLFLLICTCTSNLTPMVIFLPDLMTKETTSNLSL